MASNGGRAPPSKPRPEPIVVEDYFETHVLQHPIRPSLDGDGIQNLTRRAYDREKQAKRERSTRPSVGSTPARGTGSPMPLASTSSSTSTAFTPPPRRVPNGVNYPSQIGGDIQRMRQQQQNELQSRKRASPSPAIAGPSQKRRKLDTPQPSSSSSGSGSGSGSGQVTIPVGPPGRRTTLSMPINPPNGNEHANERLKTNNRQSAQPTAPPAANQGDKRNIETIELDSDGEIIEVFVRPSAKVSSPPPPRKKQKRSHSPQIQPGREYAVVSSDSEVEVVDVVMQQLPESKPKVEEVSDPSAPISASVPTHIGPKTEPEPALPLNGEDEEESEWDYIGDIGDSARWHSSTNHLEDEEDEVDKVDLAHLEIGETIKLPQSPPRNIRPNTYKFATHAPRRSVGSSVEFVWDMLRAAGNVHVRPRNPPRQVFTTPSHVRPWKLDFDLYNVKMQHSFKKAPGTINRIEQRGEWTAIASASVGGLPDSESDERSIPYNRPGSLLTWGVDGLDMPLGHSKLDSSTHNRTKYYAVHDVKFDPLSPTMVSSGADQKVRVWNLSDEALGMDLDVAPENKTRWTNNHNEKYYCTPHDIVFKPESSMLAVAEKSCHIYELKSEGGPQKHLHPHKSFRLHPRNKLHIIGSMVWGTGPTQDRLFASSEPDLSAQGDVPLFEGAHKVYNVVKGAFEYELDAKEAGDVMAIDSTGSMLALSTRGAVDRHILRLYDIKKKNGRATSTIHLEPFEQRYPGFEGEVNCAAFSPDGLYLSLGRNDNRAHLYDVRMLNRGPLLDYGHWGESRVSAEGDCLYGVVKMQWLWSEATRRMALATGGEDGCVRLWNPLLSGQDKENGWTVATMNSDIAHFSIGDRFKGEHQLVAGDSSGEVMIFNNIIF